MAYPMVVCMPTKRARLIRMHEKENMDFQEIGAELGISRSCASRNYAKVKETGDPYHYEPKSGRPRRFTDRDMRHATRLIETGKARDGADVREALFPTAPASTVRDALRAVGLHGRVHWPKPFLSSIHVEKRLTWAEDMLELTADDWRDVIFSDESKFNLFGSDGKQYCRRRVGEELEPRNIRKTVKHGGGNLMVWGCLTEFGPGRLHRVEGHLNAVQYCNILEESLLGTCADYSIDPTTIVFQQDGNPKHTSARAQNWFHDNNIKILRWVPSSPDMNIIEHAWEQLDRQVRRRESLPTNLEELWAILQEEWANLDMGFINRLYDSMPDRVRALHDAGGRYTRY
ncbi:Transcription factor [Mycena sanguinolenta]|uniref:Transcription factor n=1 Tax=Mycena sanguinolenta TaxID=230812 RepID=A0A8H7CMC4_9AGAR|nr:Transcription factor [Mycena sanguinolenta]